MTKQLDLDALQAIVKAVIENDGGTEHHYLMEELNEICPPSVLDALIDRLRKAEAARDHWKADAEYREELLKKVDSLRQLAAAPDSTPTDSADSATERKS